MTTADIWALTLMLVGGVFTWWLAHRLVERPDRAFVARVVALTFLLRASWSVVQHVIYPRAWILFAADARARYAWAIRDAELWREGLLTPALPTTLADTHSGLINLKTTALVYVFGPSAMLPEAVTITLNVTTVIAAYLICRHIGGTSAAARASAVFVAFLPSLVFWSTQNVKDPVTGAAIAWAMLALLKVLDRAQGSYLLLLVIANLATIVYRPYVGFMLAIGQGLAWVMTVRLPRTALGSVTRVAMVAVLAPLVLMIGVREMQETYSQMGQDLDLQWAVEQYTTFRQSGVDRVDGGSEYEIPLTANSPTEAILQLPLRVLLLLLTPIPFFPGSIQKLAVYPEMWLVYLVIVPRFGAGFREAWRKNRTALLVILMGVAPIVVSYALKTAVSGEAIRMRSQVVPVLLVFAGVGHAVFQRRKEERDGDKRSDTPASRYVEAERAAEREQTGE